MKKNINLEFKSINELRKLLDSREISSFELTENFLRRSDELESYGIFITPPSESILNEALVADDLIRRKKEKIHQLTGIPIPIKDMDPVKGLPYTHGSLPYKHFIANDDSLLVSRIKKSGGIIAGKTNTPENGYAGTTENLISSPARNPWDLKKTAGGSSGGSAVAVATGLCPFASGGDGGGSIRIPAGFTGIYGLKPTQGRVPKYHSGRKSYNISNISTSGPLTRNVTDAAIILSIIAGNDPNAEYGACSLIDQDYTNTLSKSIRDVKIGWSPTIGNNPVSSQIIRVIVPALKIFEDLGDAPKYCAVPVSNGTLFAGIYRGFVNLYKRGKTSRIPKMVAASSTKKNPIIQSFLQGLDHCQDLDPNSIKETKYNEPLINWHSFDGEEALYALRESDGEAFNISDRKLRDMTALLAKKEGFRILPASTAGLIALLELDEKLNFEPDRFVAVLTAKN